MKCRTEWSKKACHAMIDKGVTVLDIAKDLGISRVYAAGIVYGRLKAKKVGRKVADYLGIEPDEF